MRCLTCNEIIESTTRHDHNTCRCGNVSVDGGRDYLKRSYPSGDPSTWFEELAE
ncbi:DUF7695 domain-containing protein [Paenibacillus humicola]|uniref:DUF7695 domain-containing protein n=1 Tax=Paenibacillus humicola TaxID=3110540 RepID=UPI003B82EEED